MLVLDYDLICAHILLLHCQRHAANSHCSRLTLQCNVQFSAKEHNAMWTEAQHFTHCIVELLTMHHVLNSMVGWY